MAMNSLDSLDLVIVFVCFERVQCLFRMYCLRVTICCLVHSRVLVDIQVYNISTLYPNFVFHHICFVPEQGNSFTGTLSSDFLQLMEINAVHFHVPSFLYYCKGFNDFDGTLSLPRRSETQFVTLVTNCLFKTGNEFVLSLRTDLRERFQKLS